MKMCSFADRRSLVHESPHDRVCHEVKQDQKGVFYLGKYEGINPKYANNPDAFSLENNLETGFNLGAVPMMDLGSFEQKLNAVELRLNSLSDVISANSTKSDNSDKSE